MLKLTDLTEEDLAYGGIPDEYLRDLKVKCYDTYYHKKAVRMLYNDDFDCYICPECGVTIGADRESLLEYLRSIS